MITDSVSIGHAYDKGWRRELHPRLCCRKLEFLKVLASLVIPGVCIQSAPIWH